MRKSLLATFVSMSKRVKHLADVESILIQNTYKLPRLYPRRVEELKCTGLSPSCCRGNCYDGRSTVCEASV
jgi:hypothetical protein